MKIGEINRLKVLREKEYGFFLSDGEVGSKDVLLPKSNIVGDNRINIGDVVDVFIYKDSLGRLVATQKETKAVVGRVSILRVTDNTDIGSFIDIGLERDVLVPFSEKKYMIFEDEKYPFCLYVDKSERLAATTDIEPYLSRDGGLKIGDICSGYVYGFQTNMTAKVCVLPDIEGIILRNEYYTSLKEGDFIENLRVIEIYEDGRVGLSARNDRKNEMDELEQKIHSYMVGNNGYMRFNDKTDPEDIRIVFNSSKKNFKRTLGTMMKKGIIEQKEDGCYLK